jgi:hypothetical protein
VQAAYPEAPKDHAKAVQDAARSLFARGHPVLLAAAGSSRSTSPAELWQPLPGTSYEVLTVACQIKHPDANGCGTPAWVEFVRRRQRSDAPLVVLRAVWVRDCPFPLSISRMAAAFMPVMPGSGWKVRTKDICKLRHPG